MANDQVNRDNVDTSLRFGARGPRRPRAAQQPLQLETVDVPVKSARVASGNDPYNTSGSFDRTRNWARVGKR